MFLEGVVNVQSECDGHCALEKTTGEHVVFLARDL